jgi:hypothetical protein
MHVSQRHIESVVTFTCPRTNAELYDRTQTSPLHRCSVRYGAQIIQHVFERTCSRKSVLWYITTATAILCAAAASALICRIMKCMLTTRVNNYDVELCVRRYNRTHNRPEHKPDWRLCFVHASYAYEYV